MESDHLFNLKYFFYKRLPRVMRGIFPKSFCEIIDSFQELHEQAQYEMSMRNLISLTMFSQIVDRNADTI